MTDWHAIALEATTGPDINVETGRGGQQRLAELEAVLTFLAARKPQRIVEIGVHDAGTLWAWGQLTPAVSSSQVFGVDNDHRNIRQGNLDDLEPREVNVFHGNSQALGFAQDIREHFLTGPIDFLFIDGDHTHKGVIADYLAWRDLVSPTGVIGFHDTALACAPPWQEILAMQDDALSIEFVRRDDHAAVYGIGLLVLGTERWTLD